MTRRHPALALALAVALALSACQGGPAKPPVGVASARPKPAAKPTTRVLSPKDALVATQLIGKVKLISDVGGGVISNAGGQIISDSGASLISDKGLGLVSNNGGSLVSNNGGGIISDSGASLTLVPRLLLVAGKAKYGVAQAGGGLREAALADAEIELLDGAGRVLANADGPIRIKTDKTGAYTFAGALPGENLVMRVKVWRGGELRAIVPNPGGPEVAGTLDIDTPSTLGATYVLERYVKGQADVFARLPAREADALKRDMGGALLAAAEAPRYEAAAIAKAVDALARAHAPLSQTLERIEAILLLGQKGLGSGKRATEVPLTMPVAVAATAAGDVLVAEGYVGRIRRIAAKDQAVTLYAAPATDSELGYAVPGISDMRVGPDGALYVCEQVGHRILRLEPGGPKPIAGNGAAGHGAVGGPATGVDLFPSCLAFGPDGTLYIGEEAGREGQSGRLLTVGKDGVLGEIPTTEPSFVTGSIHAMAVGSDGTLYVAVEDEVQDAATNERRIVGRIGRRPPGASAWDFFVDGLSLGEHVDMLLTPEGLLVAEDNGHRIVRIGLADGAKTLVAGTGRGGFAGDGGPATAARINQPTGLYRAADGRLLFADRGNALVRAIAADGTITTVAGLHGLYGQGSGQALAVNNPFGLALDAQGRLLISEGASHTVKRFDGKELTVVAGTDRGWSGDGGPALDGRMDTPIGIGFAAGTGDLWIADSGNMRIRRVGADGKLATAAGIGRDGAGRRQMDAPLLPQAVVQFDRPIGLAVAPDGYPTFSDQGHHQVLHLRPDGQVELVAGSPFTTNRSSNSGDAGDGGPASASKVSGPMGLAYDQAGNLYIADLGNCRIRRVKPDKTIDTVAGIGLAGLLGGPAAAEATRADQVAFVAPMSVAVDAAGNLYVGEVGTGNIEAFGMMGAAADVIAMLPPFPARIRKIAPDGTVSIVAGPGGKVMTDPKGDDALVLPIGLLCQPDGGLVVADPGTNQVRLIPKEALK